MERVFGSLVDVPTAPVFVVGIYLTRTFANQAYSLFYNYLYIQYPGTTALEVYYRQRSFLIPHSGGRIALHWKQ